METEREGQDRDTEGEIKQGFCGLKKIGRGIEGKEERGEDRRKAWCTSCLETALTHMLLISRGERGGGGGERETGVVKLVRSLFAFVPGYCLFNAMADILYECLAETTEGL